MSLLLIQIFGSIAIVVSVAFVILSYIPHEYRKYRIYRKAKQHEEPLKRRDLIEMMLVTGALDSVAYYGNAADPDEEFQVIIRGPFGSFAKTGSGSNLKRDRHSGELPRMIAKVFEGYIDSGEKIVELLCDADFLKRLQESDQRSILISGDRPHSVVIAAIS